MLTPPSSPYLFEVGSLGIRYYSLAYLLGLGAAYWWLTRVGKYEREKVADLVVYSLLAIVVGGRLGYVFFYRPELIWTDFFEIFKVWHGGLSFHGGLIAVILFACWFARKQGWQLLRLFDNIVIPAALGLALATVGNFFNSELWGRVTSVPWCFQVPELEGCRHPSMLYQSLKNLILMSILSLISFRRPKAGTVGAFFLIGYGIGRSLIETLWREPSWVFLNITAGTWL
ncbi:MAG: prolipoprotein diacylglyceryl transferase, partial [bacterium]|nr:prolipoprotein diacylglyceryl transferase [bacterium]